MALVRHDIKNPITLNNADGYKEEQVSAINRTIMAIRNQWEKRTVQTKKDASLGNGIELQAGFTNAYKSYKYDHYVTCNIFINPTSMELGTTYTLVQLYDNILSFSIQGNNTNPYSEDGDISDYFIFSFEGNRIYIAKYAEVESVFSCTLNVGVE